MVDKKQKPAAVDPKVLDNWATLNEKLMSMTEDQVNVLLAHERDKGKGRLTVMLRLQSRMNKLRRERERRELVGRS